MTKERTLTFPFPSSESPGNVFTMRPTQVNLGGHETSKSDIQGYYRTLLKHVQLSFQYLFSYRGTKSLDKLGKSTGDIIGRNEEE